MLARISLARASVPRATTIRCFGITDRIMGYANEKIEGSRDEQFKKMIEVMVSTPNWTLRSWKEILEKQLGSWMRFVPGVSNSNEMKMIKNFKLMLDKMTPNELENAALVNGPARERIAKDSGQPAEDVAKMIFFYKQTRVMATWLQLKKSLGEPLPQSELEMQVAQESDVRIKSIAQSIMAPKGRKGGRGRGLPF